MRGESKGGGEHAGREQQVAVEQPEEQRGEQPQQPPHATQRRLRGRPCRLEDGGCGGRGSAPGGSRSGTSVAAAAVGGVEQLREQELGALLGLEQLRRRLVRNLWRRVRPRSGWCGPAAVVPVHVHADHDHVEHDGEDHRDHQNHAFCAHALEGRKHAVSSVGLRARRQTKPWPFVKGGGFKKWGGKF